MLIRKPSGSVSNRSASPANSATLASPSMDMALVGSEVLHTVAALHPTTGDLVAEVSDFHCLEVSLAVCY